MWNPVIGWRVDESVPGPHSLIPVVASPADAWDDGHSIVCRYFPECGSSGRHPNPYRGDLDLPVSSGEASADSSVGGMEKTLMMDMDKVWADARALYEADRGNGPSWINLTPKSRRVFFRRVMNGDRKIPEDLGAHFVVQGDGTVWQMLPLTAEEETLWLGPIVVSLPDGSGTVRFEVPKAGGKAAPEARISLPVTEVYKDGMGDRIVAEAVSEYRARMQRSKAQVETIDRVLQKVRDEVGTIVGQYVDSKIGSQAYRNLFAQADEHFAEYLNAPLDDEERAEEALVTALALRVFLHSTQPGE